MSRDGRHTWSLDPRDLDLVPTLIEFKRAEPTNLFDSDSRQVLLLASTARMRQIAVLPEFSSIQPGRNVAWASEIELNPSLPSIVAIATSGPARRANQIIAVGGGSTLDSAKVAALVIGAMRAGVSLDEAVADPSVVPLDARPTLIAVPTTAGTGSEVTPFAAVWDRTTMSKGSIDDPTLYPTHAWINPELTRGAPFDVVAASGLDAVVQCLDSIWNRRSQPRTADLASRALGVGMRSLKSLLSGSDSSADRHDLALASLASGIAISHTRTSICHSISYPLTARFGIPHGFACAFTVVGVARAVREEGIVDLSLVAEGAGFAGADELTAELTQITQAAGVIQVAEQHGLRPDDYESMLPEMSNPERMGNFPRTTDPSFLSSLMPTGFR